MRPEAILTFFKDTPSDDDEINATPAQPIDSAKLLATSLPVHILNPLMAMGGGANGRPPPPREVVAKSLQAPVELEFEISQVCLFCFVLFCVLYS